MPSASGGSGLMSWKACEPAWRRGWRCTISVSGSTSNLVVLGGLSLICWSGDLNSHQAFKRSSLGICALTRTQPMLRRSWESGFKPTRPKGASTLPIPTWPISDGCCQPALRRAGIEDLYQPNSLRGRALKTIIGAGALQGQKVWLQEDDLERLETMVASVLGVEGVRLAFYLGVPAPHRKVTAQVLTPLGKTLAYAKIATSELAREAPRYRKACSFALITEQSSARHST